MGDDTAATVNGVDNFGYKAPDTNGVSHVPEVDTLPPDGDKDKMKDEGKDKKEEEAPMVSLGQLVSIQQGCILNLNPLRAEFFKGNKNMYLHCSFIFICHSPILAWHR